MAKKVTDNSWTIHRSEKCGGKKHQISIDKWIIKVMYSYSESASEIHSVLSDSLQPHGIYSPWNSPGQNAGVGSLSLLHRIFPTQGLKPGFPHCRRFLYQLSHKRSPRILELVAYPFSNRSSQPRESSWCLLYCRWIPY